ncbi:hypothetical protein ACRTDM_20230 [Shewanella algae]|uniref:hypothetical protein n=1 Tax=Shewanella algae TaxID=38313 RepID=UPI003D7EF632
MSLPVTVYRWDDPGAPQLQNRTYAEWLEILRKCLVDGYGTKQPAGWSVLFDDAASNQVVFKTADTVPGYPGGCMWLSSRYKDGRNSENMQIRTAPSIPSLNPDWASVPGASFLYTWGGAYATKWIIIASAVSFYIMTSSAYRPGMMQGTYEHPAFGIGSIDSFYVNDVNGFGILTNHVDSDRDTSYWQFGLGYTYNGSSVGRFGQVTGEDTRKKHEVSTYFPTTQSSSSPLNGEGSPNPIYSRMIIILDAYAASSTGDENKDSEGILFKDSLLQPQIRGQFPGILVSSSAAYSDALFPVTKVINGAEHYLVPHAGSGACQYWINAESWYE